MFLSLLIIAVIFAFMLLALNLIERQDCSTTLKISYDSQTREVIVNDRFIITTFRAKSLNCEFFEYLDKNQNRLIPISELKEHVFRNRTYQLSKMPFQMGFTENLRRQLFTCTNEGIIYHPDITLKPSERIKLS